MTSLEGAPLEALSTLFLEKTNIVVSEATTVFSGQILVTDERGRSCTNNRQEYFEGASIESFTSDDDTQPYIPGATFVCYKGEWVNEEELPAPEEPIACTQEYMPVCGEYLQETCDVTKAIGGCDLPATKVQKTYSNSCEQKLLEPPYYVKVPVKT